MVANRASAAPMVANRASAVRVTVMAVTVANAVSAPMAMVRATTKLQPKPTTRQQLLKTEFLRPIRRPAKYRHRHLLQRTLQRLCKLPSRLPSL